jgi:hypothetical protein
MARNLLYHVFQFGGIACAALALAGCGFFAERPERPAWRNAAESACIAQKGVTVSRYITPRSSIDGPGICGINNPYYVTALANGSVRIKSRATLGCPMIATLDRWVKEVVQPAALARFGQPVTEISTMGSYNCRRRNHRPGAKLSEHGFGNALDIGGFTIGQERTLKVVKHWRRGEDQERAFLHETHAGACRYFRTVLGPGSDRLHENHFHLDLAMHGKSSRGLRHYCRPVIKDILPAPRQDNLPDPPLIEPDQEIARRMMPNRRFATTRPVQGLPLGNIPRNRLQPMRATSDDGRRFSDTMANSTYGRLRRIDPGAPAQLGTLVHPQPDSGSLRADGVFVPPGYGK